MSLKPRISWNAALRGIPDDHSKIPSGLLAAKASINLTVLYDCRPLFVAGKFDRSAIMRAATKAAHLHQVRFGSSASAMPVALKAAWGAANVARYMAAH